MKKPTQKLIVDIRPSRRLALFISLTHFAALLVIARLGIQYPVLLLLLVPVLVSGIRSWRVHGLLRGDRAVRRVEWGPDGEWTLFGPDGDRRSALLQSNGIVLPWITLLNFSLGGLRRRHLILLKDNCDPNQVRRLRVRLKLNR